MNFRTLMISAGCVVFASCSQSSDTSTNKQVMPVNDLLSNDMCQMFEYVSAASKEDLSCSVLGTYEGYKVTSSDGEMIVQVVKDGSTVVPASENVGASSIYDEGSSTWKNMSTLFYAKANDDANLCIGISYIAKDKKSDSIFVHRADQAKPSVIFASPGELKQELFFAEPVLMAGQSATIALKPREPDFQVSSVSFSNCPK